MALPIILWGAAAAAAAFGGKQTYDGYKNNSEAQKVIKTAEILYDMANKELEEQRKVTNRKLEELGRTKILCWSNEMHRFVTMFKKFANVKLTDKISEEEFLKFKGDILEIETNSIGAIELVKGGLGSLAAGVVSGIAAYGGVGVLATASTGTAISTLSGVAATKATLAWLGGGSLASGGAGVAGGTVALGGIVIAPILAVGGSIYKAKSEKNLAKAQNHYANAKKASEEMYTVINTLANIYNIADDYDKFIKHFAGLFNMAIITLESIYEKYNTETNCDIVDFECLSIEEQEKFHLAWLMAQTMKSVLIQKLITDDGKVDTKANVLLNDIKAIGEFK